MPRYSLLSEMDLDATAFAAIELRDCPHQGDLIRVPGPRTFVVDAVLHDVEGETRLVVQAVDTKGRRLA